MSTFFFFNDTATTEIYTLSLHDALPICYSGGAPRLINLICDGCLTLGFRTQRSEEHTSELQSQSNLVCRLLLEKKNNCTQNPASLCLHFATSASRPIRRPSHCHHLAHHD